jgi:hypothetical protein
MQCYYVCRLPATTVPEGVSETAFTRAIYTGSCLEPHLAVTTLVAMCGLYLAPPPLWFSAHQQTWSQTSGRQFVTWRPFSTLGGQSSAEYAGFCTERLERNQVLYPLLPFGQVG